MCALAVDLKHRLGYDDSLDVAGVHLTGGLWGTVSIGLLGTAAAPAGVDGLLYGGGVDQLWRQTVGALAVLAFSFTATYLIASVLHRLVGLRVTEAAEVAGIDATEHAERGYVLGVVAADGDRLGRRGGGRAVGTGQVSRVGRRGGTCRPSTLGALTHPLPTEGRHTCSPPSPTA